MSDLRNSVPKIFRAGEKKQQNIKQSHDFRLGELDAQIEENDSVSSGSISGIRVS
jgi:hypothetical protein